jgi:hypothetical protein
MRLQTLWRPDDPTGTREITSSSDEAIKVALGLVDERHFPMSAWPPSFTCTCSTPHELGAAVAEMAESLDLGTGRGAEVRPGWVIRPRRALEFISLSIGDLTVTYPLTLADCTSTL